MKNVDIEPSWHEKLMAEFEKPYFEMLTQFVRAEYANGLCFPPGKLIFNAFNQCPFDNVKVVLIGQDPYHEPGQAQGLCFSVGDGVKFPPSLRNIFTEIQSDLGVDVPDSGDLTRWAKQGVLLLNATLTVRAHAAVIRAVSEGRDNVVFMLWGSYAQSKAKLIDSTRHCVLKSAHPSPLSAYRGFFGNHHFSICNQYLQQHGQEAINW